MVQLRHFSGVKRPHLAHKKYINILMLLRVEGYLLAIEAIFMCIPCLISLFFETESSIPFLIAIAITGGAGLLMMFLKPKSREMGRREAILLTGMTWIILSMFGMLPFIFYGTHLSVTDAFFETMSGFTTTGASILSTLDNIPKSIIFWRCLIQWIGGLGILLFTLAVLPMLNSSGGMLLFNAEVTGITHDKLRPRVSATAKGLWGIYIIFTIAMVILLSFSNMDFFDSLCYSLSTVSTGGFTTSDAGIAQYSSVYVKVVMVIFMFLGGVNLSLIYNAVIGRTLNLFNNTVFKTYVIVIVVAYVLFVINVWMEGLVNSALDVTIDPLFQAISVLSSTGILEPDFKNWGPLSDIVLIILMTMGACAGSTSGGAKIDRFVILAKFIKNEFYKIMHPSAVTTVVLNGRGTQPTVISKTLAFLFLYALVVLIGGSVLSLSGIPMGESFYICLQAIANTGIGTDSTGICGDFSLLPAYAKWMLSLIMLIGRLEIFTVILVLTPSFWKR